ncbi:MAG TPA: PAS domain-containing sensor histidine kinase [Actinoplanes sp.]|nr:PAS domain-containing sensor histidine kinase [Actinoplanes sp.]
MRIAAQDVGRLSRTVGAAVGAAVTAAGLLALLSRHDVVPLDGLAAGPAAPTPTMAAALGVAGVALLLLAPPAPGRARRRTGYVLAGFTALIGLASLVDSLSRIDLTAPTDRLLGGTAAADGHVSPAAALAVLLCGTALAVIDLRRTRASGAPLRLTDPLVAGAAMIALVALVPLMFAPTFPAGRDPSGVMSPWLALALLALAVGIILVRPEQGPLRTASATGPAVTLRRRLGPALLALPFAAALVSALASRTGISRPAAAISTGAILAGLGLLALIAYLVRSLEGADRRQQRLVADLNARREFTDTLLQSMNEAVMVLDANHRVIDVNRRWMELTGHRPEDAVGRQPPYPWGPDAATGPDTGGEGGDGLLQRPDGVGVPVLATMAAVPDAAGKPQAYVATYVDIGERKRAEEALAAHAEELERSNAQLREANNRLEAALAFKSDLMAMLSHDVAQPISSIASLSELLSSDWSELPEDIRLELAMKIEKNTSRLIRMMNDLQLLFRLDTGTVTARRTPVPVGEVVQTVADSLEAEGVHIHIADDVSVLADRGHVWHVVQNLLSNAVKYGEPPVEVQVTRQADRILLVVQDAGPGIPQELVPRLFDRFMRGAGLGLFIVRHLMEANGGSVRYERAVPRGARLIVGWEAATMSVPGAEPAPGTEGTAEGG